MLSKLFRSFVGGDQNTEPTPSRKRKAVDLDEDDDVIITNSKRCKKTDSTRENGWPISGRVAEWLVKSKRTFEQSYYVRKIKTHASPSNILERFSTYRSKRPVADREGLSLPACQPRPEFAKQGGGSFLDMSQNRSSLNTHHHTAPHSPSPSATTTATTTVTTTLPHSESLVCSSGAVAAQPRPQPKTGYVDLPYPFVFPADVIWTQDGQFKIPMPKPGGDTSMRQQNMRPPFRMEQRPVMPSSIPPKMSSGVHPYNGSHGTSTPHSVPPGGYQPIFDKMYRQNSAMSSSSTGITDSIYRSRLAAKESIRLDEKSRYEQLLQQFTSIPLTTQDASRPRRHTPTTRSRDQTLLGTSIAHITHAARRSSSYDTKPEVIEVTAHSGSPPSPIIDLTTSHSELASRLQDGPASESTPKTSMGSGTNASGLGVKPKVLIPVVSQNGSIVQKTKRSSLERSHSPRSPEVIILDSPPPLSPKTFVMEGYERSLKELKYSEEWLQNFTQSHSEQARQRSRYIHKEELKKQVFEEECEERDRMLENELKRRLKLGRKVPTVEEYEYVESSSSEEEEEEEADEYPELTDEQEELVNAALVPRPDQELLSEGFRLQVRRADMVTLKGLNWLNDEVVNFYFELIRDRGKLDNFPSVHVFNTFFYPKVKNQGQQGVRRWTKSVDIYSFDYIAIPIHLGMHWCLAVVDFGKKAICYFDSMGGRNMECLNILKKYLEDEHKQKKGSPYDMSDWTLENVQGLPQQMNGSDCGVFTCKYADYVCRGRQITFSQENMPYFRRRMVLEILNKALL